jgi:hypothetical protein
MFAKLLIPYFPEGEVANDVNEMSDEEYANALLNTFGGEYSRYMNSVIDNFTDSRYDMMELMPEKYQIKGVKDNARVSWYAFDCQLNNEEDENMPIEEFSYYANSGEMCAFFVHILMPNRRDEIDPDAISELNFWLRDSINVQRDPHIDDDHRVGMLPSKDLIIQLNTTDNLMLPSKYTLMGSRIIDEDNANNFAIIVNKIKNV